MESFEAPRISGVGSGSSGTCAAEIAESLRFQEEIQSLIVHPNFEASNGSSFTALLGLSGNQAAEILREHGHTAAASSPAGAAEMWQLRLGGDSAAAELRLPLGCSPTFPSDAALVERAARFSVLASEESPASSSGGDISPRLKVEQLDTDSPPSLPILPSPKTKRKETCEKSKARGRGTAKKFKRTEEKNDPTKGATTEEDTAGEKLPYVHVRARRGQATDSHSLAERARREKINARMKFLQELVPGCSKITGTALVLDEIINHVQSLQRQVEFLSMRLAAVNPRIDNCFLDNFLSTQYEPGAAAAVAANGREALAWDPAPWSPDSTSTASEDVRRLLLPRQYQVWHLDLLCPQQSSMAWERDATLHHDALLFTGTGTGTSLSGYDSTNSVPLNANQSKTEL